MQQKDMLPLMACGCEKGQFKTIIAQAAGVKEEDILAQDLFLYSRFQAASGEHRRNSYPADAWMTCSVHLPD